MEFMRSPRLGFHHWWAEDLPLACALWGLPEVMRYIDVRGGLNPEQVKVKLDLELETQRRIRVQYWPVFESSSGELVGCCGLKPWVHSARNGLELGFHFLPSKWGLGYAPEAARRVLEFAQSDLHADAILAGHHPDNAAAKAILTRLGFVCFGSMFYAPTGLQHPAYEWKGPIS